MTKDKELTVREVAAIIGISGTSIRSYIKEGVIKAKKRFVRSNQGGVYKWFIPSTEIEKARLRSGLPKDDFSNIDLELLEETSRFKQKLDPEMVELAEKLIRGEITVPQMVQSIQNQKESLKSPEISVKVKDVVKPLVGTIKPMLKADDHNWMFIGDNHMPYDNPRYFDFCAELKHKYQVTKLIYMGDVIDNHALSYHESNPNLYAASDELQLAKKRLKKWYELDPEAIVCEGNHCKLHKRKATTAGLPSEWMKSTSEVLGVPGWEFVIEFETDKFIAGHGDDGANMKNKLVGNKSYVQGHYHSKSHLTFVSEHQWMMQVGFGGDKSSPAFAYAGKGAKRNINSLGLYVDGNPLLITMK